MPRLESLEERVVLDATSAPPPPELNPAQSGPTNPTPTNTTPSADEAMAYMAYQSATWAAYDTYMVAEAAARSTLSDAVNTAVSAYEATASGVLDTALTGLGTALGTYNSTSANAFTIYSAAVASANSDYDSSLAPYQAALSAAQTAAEADPMDPALQQAVEQAQTDLATAEGVAAPIFTAALTSASATFSLALAGADDQLGIAQTAVQTTFASSLSIAVTDLQAAEQAAVDAYKSAEEAAWATYLAAEQSAWSALEVATANSGGPQCVPHFALATRPQEVVQFKADLIVTPPDLGAVSELAQNLDVRAAMADDVAALVAPPGPDAPPPPPPLDAIPSRTNPYSTGDGLLPGLPWGTNGAVGIRLQPPASVNLTGITYLMPKKYLAGAQRDAADLARNITGLPIPVGRIYVKPPMVGTYSREVLGSLSFNTTLYVPIPYRDPDTGAVVGVMILPVNGTYTVLGKIGLNVRIPVLPHPTPLP